MLECSDLAGCAEAFVCVCVCVCVCVSDGSATL